MPVYFVQAGDDGPVKIGRATDPAARIAILQTGHHERLRVLRTIEGGASAETWLHRRFAPSRLRGEWFRFDDEMLTVEPLVPSRRDWRDDLGPSYCAIIDAELGEIDAFLAETQMTPTAFGRDALGDPGFVFGLRDGRDCRRSTVLRAREQMLHFRRNGEFIRRPTPRVAAA